MDLTVILGAHVKRYSLDIYKTCWDLQLKYLGGDCAHSLPSLPPSLRPSLPASLVWSSSM